jgi:hypothetical protein
MTVHHGMVTDGTLLILLANQVEHAASLLEMALMLTQHQANWQHVPLKTIRIEFANSIRNVP